ncbi:MAG: hypothetical protein OK455_09915 [Thaumarchaeota archaeon]|nr:hypothetical protein [Nitrososphaerota archaeon]
MDDTLKALLSKETSFKPVEAMEGSKVSREHVEYLNFFGLTTAKTVAECQDLT